MASTEGVSAGLAAVPARTRHPGAASRILFTVGALVVCRLATHVPVPGIDPAAWEMVAWKPPPALGAIDLIGGGAMHRAAIVALGLMPFFNAALIVEVVSAFLPKRDRSAVNRRTRYLAVALAVVQSYGLAVGFEGLGEAVVGDPGPGFRLSTMATLTGGTVLLLWLADQITVRGVGNGLVLVILSGILAGLPDASAGVLRYAAQGVLSADVIVAAAVATIAVTVFMVVVAGARTGTPPAQARAPGGAVAAAPVYVLLFSGSGHPVLAAALMVFFAVFWTARTSVRGITRQDLVDVFAGARNDTAGGAAGDDGRRHGAPGTAPSVVAVARRLGVVAGLQLAAAGAVMDAVFAMPSHAGLRLVDLPFPFAGSLVVIVVTGALDTLASVRAVATSAAADR